MQALAARLAALCRAGDCLLLSGDLGAGKTSFARGFIGALCPGAGEVVSPTFTLAQTYPMASGTLWHFDLYRLKNPAEVAEIGLEEALQTGLTLIEWPDIIRQQLPKDALLVTIRMNDPLSRSLVFSGQASAWEPRLKRLKDTL